MNSKEAILILINGDSSFKSYRKIIFYFEKLSGVSTTHPQFNEYRTNFTIKNLNSSVNISNHMRRKVFMQGQAVVSSDDLQW